jgi:hypothetical protein
MPKAKSSHSRNGSASSHPTLSAAEIALLTSRFNGEKWDATADADHAAEEAARHNRHGC